MALNKRLSTLADTGGAIAYRGILEAGKTSIKLSKVDELGDTPSESHNSYIQLVLLHFIKDNSTIGGTLVGTPCIGNNKWLFTGVLKTTTDKMVIANCNSSTHIFPHNNDVNGVGIVNISAVFAENVNVVLQVYVWGV